MAAAAAVVAIQFPDAGSFYAVRYNGVPGPMLYHERLILLRSAAMVAGGGAQILTPDQDHYEEAVAVGGDIMDLIPLAGQGAPAWGVPDASVYRFRALPPAGILWGFIRTGAAAVGHPVPAHFSYVLGARNVLGAPIGPYAVPDPTAGVAVVPAVGPVAAAPPAGGLGALAAAIGGAPPAAAAPVPGAVVAGLVAPAAAVAAAVAPPVGAAAPAVPPAAAGAVVSADLRVMPVKYDSRGERFRTYVEAVGELSEVKFADWPVAGPRTFIWCSKHMLAQAGSPTAWHSKWIAEQKLDPSSPNVGVHENACRVFETLLCYDQGNGGNLASGELVARQIQLCEERERDAALAVSGGKDKKKEQALKVDLSAEHHLYMGGGHTRGNLCICPLLSEWIALELQKEASVLKERRKAREERGLRAPP